MSSSLARALTRAHQRSVPLAPIMFLSANLLVPTAVGAQAPPAQAPVPPAVSSSPFTAGFQNGFALQSANGDNRLQFGAVVQLDGRFSVDDPLPITNTFTLRKARPILSGRIARHFDYRVMSEFGGGTATILDAYVDIRFSPALRIRSGKDKTPVGYELLVGDAALLFPERSLASSLVPNRDVGIQVQGDLAGGKLFYAGGVFNGVVDGASSTADVDTNTGKDLAGRIVIQPFRTSTTPVGALNGLGIQVGGSVGSQTGALPAFRTSAGSQTYFSYGGVGGSTPAAVASGDRQKVTPAVFYYYKSFGVFGEYARATQSVSRGATTRAITNQGWNVSGAYLLTGETASAGVPTPRSPFDPPTGKWGAVQVVARYSQLTVDQVAFDAGFAAGGASRIAKAATVGLNWYPVQPVKYYLTYERTAFEGPTPRPTENTILFRVQLAF